MDKWSYIEMIRNFPSNDKNLLLDLMDKCNKCNTRNITFEEAKEYYENLVERKGENYDYII